MNMRGMREGTSREEWWGAPAVGRGGRLKGAGLGEWGLGFFLGFRV